MAWLRVFTFVVFNAVDGHHLGLGLVVSWVILGACLALKAWAFFVKNPTAISSGVNGGGDTYSPAPSPFFSMKTALSFFPLAFVGGCVGKGPTSVAFKVLDFSRHGPGSLASPRL